MFAGSAAARRRRVLIAARAEPGYGDDESPVDQSGSPGSMAEDDYSAYQDGSDGDDREFDVPGRSQWSPRRENDTDAGPRAGDDAPAQQPGGLSRIPSNDAAAAGRGGLPARPRQTSMAAVRSRLRPSRPASSQWRPVELCVTSRLTGEAEVLRIDSPIASIGRGSQCDIRLMHPDVSRRHACLQVLEAGVMCFDLGGRTGVLWGGQRRPVGWISTQDAAVIGPFEVRLATPDDAIAGAGDEPLESAIDKIVGEDDEDPVDAGALMAAEPALETIGFEVEETPSAGTLSLASDSGKKRFMPLRSSVTRLGRGADCELRLKDDRISRVHSSVMASSEGVWLVDLAGRGGVRVNGSCVSHARLEPGDEVAVGEHRLRFVMDRRLAPGSYERESAPFPRETSARAAVLEEVPPTETIREPNSERYVSESLVMAMAEAFAQMQRQMQEQHSMQMSVMAEMVESLRQETREDVRAELGRLKALGEEISKAQSELNQAGIPYRDAQSESNQRLDESRPDPSIDAEPSREESRIIGSETAEAGAESSTTVETCDPDAEPIPSTTRPEAAFANPREDAPEARRTTRKHPDFRGAATGRDGIADHALVSRRLRELEEERDSRWQKIRRLLNPGR